MATLQRKTIPGPRSLNPLKATFAFRSNPLRFLIALQQQYGDIAQFLLAIWPTVFITHPDAIKHVLQDNHQNYNKDAYLFRIGRPLVGNGLASAVGGDDWLRQRRLVQPAFHHQRIAALGTLMVAAINVMLEQWETSERQSFDIAEEMSSLTFKIACKSLFNVEMASNSFRQSFAYVHAFLINY